MRFQFPDGQVVMLDQPFLRDGVQYPANWLRAMTVEERNEWGLTELPEPEAPVTPAPPAVPVEVSARQARLALYNAGLLETVEQTIAQAPRNVQIEWEYATVFRRDNALLNQLWATLGYTEAQLDALFTSAASIPA